MGTYDIFMLLVLVGAVAFGAWKGLAWQIASLASLVVSYFVALTFSAPLAPYFGDSAPWNRFLAMLVLYVGSSAVIWLSFGVLRKGINRVKLQEFDRQMGALVGGLKGVIICTAITFFAVTLMEDPTRGNILHSHSGRAIGNLIDKADAIAPPEVHEVLGPYLHTASEAFGNDPHTVLPGTASGFFLGNQPEFQPDYFTNQSHQPTQPQPVPSYPAPGFDPGFQPSPPLYPPQYQPANPPVSQPTQPPANGWPNWGS